MQKGKNNSTQDNAEENLSFCDIMKDDTSEVIKKLESNMPSMFQNYSDMYAKYLHALDDIFGTCYIAEKEFLDKLNIDQDILKQIKQNSNLIKKNYIENIEITTRIVDMQIKVGMKSIELFDNYSHIMMESYAKILANFNKSSSSIS